MGNKTLCNYYEPEVPAVESSQQHVPCERDRFSREQFPHWSSTRPMQATPPTMARDHKAPRNSQALRFLHRMADEDNDVAALASMNGERDEQPPIVPKNEPRSRSGLTTCYSSFYLDGCLLCYVSVRYVCCIFILYFFFLYFLLKHIYKLVRKYSMYDLVNSIESCQQVGAYCLPYDRPKRTKRQRTRTYSRVAVGSF